MFLAVALGTDMLKGDSVGGQSTIYDPNPKQLWNRVNETLFCRTGPDGVTYGFDELDPLVWTGSQYLLQGDSHKRALAVLDEFLTEHGEKLVRDPLKRAWLQHDLWLLFDRTASHSGDANFDGRRQDLERRLAQVIRRLELTPQEIASLPDNYEISSTNAVLQSFAGGLFKEGGGWVCLGAQGQDSVAPVHMESFGGRSVFLVMAHFPDSAAEAESYLRRLAAISPKWINVTNTPFTNVIPVLNTNVPQFPAGTQWALVRRMCVIDSSGQIQATRLTEGIQARYYVAIRGFNPGPSQDASPQRTAEFRMDRRQNGILRTVGEEERDFFPHFLSQGVDPFEMNAKQGSAEVFPKFRVKILAECFKCHGGPGLVSVPTFTGNFFLRARDRNLDSSGNPAREVAATTFWKNNRFDWGLLQGLWLRSN